jgi:hypothetical protein
MYDEWRENPESFECYHPYRAVACYVLLWFGLCGLPVIAGALALWFLGVSADALGGLVVGVTASSVVGRIWHDRVKKQWEQEHRRSQPADRDTPKQ